MHRVRRRHAPLWSALLAAVAMLGPTAPTAGAPVNVGHPRPPVIDGIDPADGPRAGGTAVTVTGGHFLPGRTSVTICGRTIPADSVAVEPGAGSLTFTAPPCPGRNALVTVRTAGGRSDAVVFGYLGDPPPAPGDAIGAQLAVGVALLIAGVLLLAVYRRPRRPDDIDCDEWRERAGPDREGGFVRRPG